MKKVLLGVAAVSLTSCLGVEEQPLVPAELPFEQRHDTIINGEPPNAAMHRAVVSLHVRSGNQVDRRIFCSGTLISDTVVLTAAHCLDRARTNSKNYITASPDTVAIYVGDTPLADPAPAFFAVTQTLIHPSFNRTALRNDIALVRLAAPVPAELATPVPALPAAAGFSAADVGGLVLNFAGFGRDENGASSVKLQADGLLGSLGCRVAGCPNTGDAATQIAYAQQEDGPCSGDSGGPAFLYRDGVAYVGGVTSYGDSYCTIYGVSTRADAYQAWIDAFVSPAPPPPPPPDCTANGVCNAECAAGADPDCAPAGGGACGDGVCDADESCDGRSGTTACASDCPGRVSGPKNGRYCYVGGACTGPGCP